MVKRRMKMKIRYKHLQVRSNSNLDLNKNKTKSCTKIPKKMMKPSSSKKRAVDLRDWLRKVLLIKNILIQLLSKSPLKAELDLTLMRKDPVANSNNSKTIS